MFVARKTTKMTGAFNVDILLVRPQGVVDMCDRDSLEKILIILEDFKKKALKCFDFQCRIIGL